MERPAAGAATGAAEGAAEAGAGGGGARRYLGAEADEAGGQGEPPFDREVARRLWEEVSTAQPVGPEAVERMIQKNQCLFTSTQCKLCCALLVSESQKLAHYQSKKHASRVKKYLEVHGMETLKGEIKKLGSDQDCSRSKDKNQCCPVCNMTLSSPAVAQSHYLGKTHAKNLKLKQQSTKVEGSRWKPWNLASGTRKRLLSETPPQLPEEFSETEDESFSPSFVTHRFDLNSYQGDKAFPSESFLTCPITWGSVKRLADNANTLLEEVNKPRTSENMMMAFMTQITINSEKKRLYDSSTTSSQELEESIP